MVGAVRDRLIACGVVSPTSPVSAASSVLHVREDGRPIDFTFQEILNYHGRWAPAGVAHAFKVMELAFPLLDPDDRVERREITITTAFGGPGARDAFEAVTRAVTGERYTVDAGLAEPERGPTMADYVFQLCYRARVVRLRLRPGHVHEEFVSLARTREPTVEQAERLRTLKVEMTQRLLPQRAGEIYEQL